MNQWTVFQNISELPLYLFVDASVDDRLGCLIKSGYPNRAQLEKAFEELLTQFNEAMGDSESRLFFSLHKQIIQKEIDIQNVDFALIMLTEPERLTPKGIQRFRDFLNEILFSAIVLDIDDPEDYNDKLQIWRNMSASIRMARDLKRIQYDSIKEKQKSAGKKPDRAYYQMVLLNLSDYAQYEITDKISTFEFCERFRRLSKFLESTPVKK